MGRPSRLPAAWLLVLVIAVLSPPAPWRADSFSTGAPDSACTSMKPSHGSNAPQSSNPPFQITPGDVSVDGGKKVTVTLATATPTGSFKGFFLQARDSNTSQPIGTFVTDQYKYLTCLPGFNNVVTHPNPVLKVSVVLEWAAPANYDGEVAFRATVVQDYDNFWIGITSEKVTVKRAAPAEVPTTTTTTNAPVTSVPSGGGLSGALDSIYLGCSVNKGCFGLPLGCENAENCDSLFTYTKTSDGYQFELMGTVMSGNAYAAGGLSHDYKMGSDSVMACRSYQNIADITMAWNLVSTKSNSFLKDQKQGLSDYEMKQIDGKLYCRFTRQAKMEIEGKQFDLDNEKFYLMIAQGPLAADGSLLYHEKKQVSNQATYMSAFETLGTASDLFVTLHACFMVAAWVGAASSGILLARYFKQTWKNYKTFNIDQWFHFHRLFMMTTWGLTMAGFVLIMIHVGGWTSVPANTNPHAYIGIVSIVLCFIQPFIAACRCSPTDSRRPVFNWIHWFVGNAAQTLGITAIFFGLELYGLPRWTWWVMIVFVGFHCLMHIILSIGECVSDSKTKNQVSGIAMKDFNSSRDMLQPPPQDKLLDAPGGTFRKAMLAVYLLVIWLLVITLLLVIIVGEHELQDWNLIFWDE
uniref:Ferric-chelate reductase 1 homolog n=3 Tax=Hirondellea gigas TaxID=1518452 RepID=A0A2P2I8J2_9CRUS